METVKKHPLFSKVIVVFAFMMLMAGCSKDKSKPEGQSSADGVKVNPDNCTAVATFVNTGSSSYKSVVNYYNGQRLDSAYLYGSDGTLLSISVYEYPETGLTVTNGYTSNHVLSTVNRIWRDASNRILKTEYYYPSTGQTQTTNMQYVCQ